jgi:Mg2+ and Co2+ transporter CorA
MTPYELKQGILDKMENELLIERIVKLEKEIGELQLKIKLANELIQGFRKQLNFSE